MSFAMHFRITSVLCYVGGKQPHFSYSKFSQLQLSLLDNRLNFSREEIRFFLFFLSISVVCLHELADCGVCDNLSFHMPLYLPFLNKLCLHTVLP